MPVSLRSQSHLGYGSHSGPSVPAPSGVLSGDAVLMTAVVFATSSPPTPTPPAGFVAWTGTIGGLVSTLSKTGWAMSLFAWVKISAGSEPSTYAVSQTSASSDYRCGAYIGVNNTTPMGAFASAQASVTGQTSTAASVTPTVNGSLVEIVAGDDADTSNNLVLTGWTNEIASPIVLGVLDMIQTTAGATGSQTFTNNNANNGTAWWLTATLVLNAASSGGGSRTASDTSASSDSASRAIPQTRTGTDTSVSTDASSRTEPKSRTASDTCASSDAAARSALTRGRATADASASIDSAARAQPRTRASSDASVSSDSTSRGTQSFTRTASETSASSDSASTGAGGGARTGRDISVSTDSASRHVVFTRSSTDASSSTDSAGRTVPRTRFTADTSLMSDTTSRGALHYGRTGSDVSHSGDVAAIPSNITIWLPLKLGLKPATGNATMKGKTLSLMMKAEPTALVLDPATTKTVISG